MTNGGDQSRANVQLSRNKFAHYLSFLRDYSPSKDYPYTLFHGGGGWKQISRFSKRFPSAFVSRIRVECSLLEPFVRITLASRAATIDWRRSESNVEVTIPTESSRESFNRGKSSVITEEEREVHGEGGARRGECTMVMRWCG